MSDVTQNQNMEHNTCHKFVSQNATVCKCRRYNDLEEQLAEKDAAGKKMMEALTKGHRELDYMLAYHPERRGGLYEEARDEMAKALAEAKKVFGEQGGGA